MKTRADHRKTIEEYSKKQQESFQDIITKQEGPLTLFDRKDFTIPETLQANKSGRQLRFLKRMSPFLLLEFFLVVLFPYMMITGSGVVHNKWLLLFLFIFIEVNVLFTDFALWNYFKGKKILRIWLIEIPLTFLIIHFLI